MTEAPEALLFNPFDPAFRVDPYSVYARLRAEEPVHESPIGALVFSRYAHCQAILKDPRASSESRNSDNYKQAVEQGTIDPAPQEIPEPFLFRDPPDHTRLRSLVSKAFTPKSVEGLRPAVQQKVDELLDAIAEKGEMETVEDLAYPLPVFVICELLGVPAEDQATFRVWSKQAARSLDPVEVLSPEVQAEREKMFDEFVAYFRTLIEERRKTPSDDILSALIAAEERGDKLTSEELISTCLLLLIAGHETTVNLISNGVLALLRHPDQLARLEADPSLAGGAVEEVLRYDPPVQMTIRTALDDIDVAGATIKKGQQSVLLLASANRDAERFPDPDRFDITRTDASHNLSFGYGIHACLGAPLARLEGVEVFQKLVQRLHGMELRTDVLQYKENIVLRGLEALAVGFRSAD
ncbi:MAG: cytochrome P450 [Dehalococcoidia bacterium]